MEHDWGWVKIDLWICWGNATTSSKTNYFRLQSQGFDIAISEHTDASLLPVVRDGKNGKHPTCSMFMLYLPARMIECCERTVHGALAIGNKQFNDVYRSSPFTMKKVWDNSLSTTPIPGKVATGHVIEIGEDGLQRLP